MYESEQWRNVVGYEGYYQVSNMGRVRSVDRVVTDTLGRQRAWKGKILRTAMGNQYKHFAVSLRKRGTSKTTYIHQIVAMAWIGPCPNGKQVRHGPNGKLDNSVSNLCYGTWSEQHLDKRRDGTHGGRPVRRNDGIEFISMAVAAEETGCRASNIWRVCNGKRNTAGRYSWEYI